MASKILILINREEKCVFPKSITCIFKSNLIFWNKYPLSSAFILVWIELLLCFKLECVLAAGKHCDKIILKGKTSKIRKEAQLISFFLKVTAHSVFSVQFEKCSIEQLLHISCGALRLLLWSEWVFMAD